MTDDGPATRTVRLSSLDRRCVQTTKTPFSVSGFRNGGDGGDDGGRSDGRLDDGFLRGKSGQAGGREDGATGAGGAPATATLLRPRPVRLSPRCSWSKRAIVRGRALSLVSLLARPRRGCGNARMWRNRRIARPRSWCGHMAFISTSSEHVRKTWR